MKAIRFTRKKYTAVSAPILTKLTDVQQQYMRMFRTTFHPYRSVNVDSIDMNSLHPYVKRSFQYIDFDETGTYASNFCGYFMYRILSKSDENYKTGKVLSNPLKCLLSP